MNKGWMKAVYLSIAVAGVAALAVNIATHAGRDTARQEQLKQFPAAMQQPDRQASADKVRIIAAYGRQPMGFEANQGQVDESVRYLSRGAGYILFLTDNEAVLSLSRTSKSKDERAAAMPERAMRVDSPQAGERAVLRMQLAGASAHPSVTVGEQLPGHSNYLIGNDPDQWRSGVPLYDRVSYGEVYPGIDLAFYGNQRQLEFDFIVAPGADPQRIAMSFTGAERMALDETGNLVLHIGEAQVIQHRPVAYQMIGGERQLVDGHFRLDRGKVGFELAAYDTSRPLVIDPVLVYSTYLGGSGGEVGYGIAVNSGGNAWVTGGTVSADFPTQNAQQSTTAGGGEAFVTEMDANGQLVYSTYLGGSGNDEGLGIAIDSSGNAWVTGDTASTDFPILNALQPTYGGGFRDGFVTRLDALGYIVYSTYLGGSDREYGWAIEVDGSGNAWVTGYTRSVDFPTTLNALQSTYGGGYWDGFVTGLDAIGTLSYSTYMGGSGDDNGRGIAVDSSSNVWVTGWTVSADFPTTLNAQQPTFGGMQDAFVARFDAGGVLNYSSYLGGSGAEAGMSIAEDGNGHAYVTGLTTSVDFPTLNAQQPSLVGGFLDAFVTSLDASGALIYSTYLGGTGYDQCWGISVDSGGNASVSGWTSSTDFPTTPDALQLSNAGGTYDAFVTSLNASGALIYSTYLGGSADDYSLDIGVDGAGNTYVTGYTVSIDFPTQNAIQGAYAGGQDAFVTKIAVNGPSTFTYADFCDLSAMTLSGSTASIGNPVNFGGQCVLRLTNNLGQAGGGFVTYPVSLANNASFSTAFSFQITNPMGIWDNDGQGADGLVFVVQPQSNQHGGAGVGLGYQGLSNSVGIEFDTWNNGWHDGYNGNHVAIDLNGSVNSVVRHNIATRMNNGAIWHAWVDYDGASQLLEVRLSQTPARPAAATLSYTVDLPVVLGQTDAFVGFTSGTGSAGGDHDIRSWEFANTFTPIGNMPPTADAGLDQTIECTGASSASVALDGSLSSDPDPNDVLIYTWSGPFGTVTGMSPTVSMSLGVNQVVTLTVDDGNGHTATDDVLITVQDTMPPTVSAGPDVTLEATDPNGADYDVSAQANASDSCCGATLTAPALATYPLGPTTVAVSAVDCSGNSASDQMIVNVVDTTQPTVTAQLIPIQQPVDDDKDDGEQHSEGLFKVVFTASDIADANPTVTATLNGQTVTNGQIVKLERDDEAKAEFEHGQLEIAGMSFMLNVSATDASGNKGTASDAYVFPAEHADEDKPSHDKDD